MEEYIMGTNLPDNFSDGQELEASELNKMLVARSNSMLPIDDTTRNETDLAGGLGSATKRYTEAHIDNIKIDGNTISSTDEDGDINLVPDGDGRINLTNLNLYGDYGTLQTHTRTTTGTTNSSNIEATKDIAVTGYIDGSGTAQSTITVLCYSDSSSTPSTVVAKYSYINALQGAGSFHFNVKKGNYYKISTALTVSGGTHSVTTNWREIEIGA